MFFCAWIHRCQYRGPDSDFLIDISICQRVALDGRCVLPKVCVREPGLADQTHICPRDRGESVPTHPPQNLSILINDPLIVAKCQLSLAPDTTQVHRCERSTHTHTQKPRCDAVTRHQTTSSHLWARHLNAESLRSSGLDRNGGENEPGPQKKTSVQTERRLIANLIRIVLVNIKLCLLSRWRAIRPYA